MPLGSISIKTENAGQQSGSINIVAGDSDSQIAGSISMRAGSSSTVDGGNVLVSSGSSTVGQSVHTSKIKKISLPSVLPLLFLSFLQPFKPFHQLQTFSPNSRTHQRKTRHLHWIM